MAIIVGSVFLSRDLNIIRIWPNPLFFLLFVAADSVVSLVGLAFVANRRPDYQFVQSLVIDTKILFLFPLSVMGAFGILSSIGISIVLCLGISSMLLAKVGIRPSFGIDWKFLKESSRFSAGTYVAGSLAVTGAWILPIMILNMLGAEEAAQYYISYAIASLLFLVPSAFGTSLFVEGSHGESLRATALRATVGTYLLLVPMAVILYISGQFLLDIVGEEYVEGLNLLRIMIFSSFFLTTWSIFSTIKKIQKDMRTLLALSGFILVTLTSTAYAFIARFGLIGVGYAWLTTFALVTVIIVVLAGEAQWLRPRNSSHKKPNLKEP
jgi:O-antigen/teichoic acid export membrane protein